MRKSNKGFTLVELLAVVVILGIITAIGIPIIRNISSSNLDKQYNVYRNTLKQGTKLYIDSYGEDLFGTSSSGCAKVRYRDLADKGLIKDIPVSDVSCDSVNTFVMVLKVDNKYGYSVYMDCGEVGPDGNRLSTETVNTNNADIACDPMAKTIMYFSTDPVSSTSLAFRSRTIQVSVTSYTGINDNARVYYGFHTDRNSTNPEGGWKNLDLHIPGKTEQARTLANGQPVIATATVTTPTGGTGRYYLIIKVDTLENRDAKSWSTEVESLPIEATTFGVFTVDNTKPKFNDSSIISTDSYHTLTPKLNLKATDVLADIANLKMCITYDSETPCPTALNEIKNGSSYRAYVDYSSTDEEAKKLRKIQSDYDLAGSHEHVIHVTIADPAGNYITKDFNYEVAYTITYMTNGGTGGTTAVTYCDKGATCTLRANGFTKTGYSFDGWWTAASGGTKYGATTTIATNTVVYAHWKPNAYTVTFDRQGGSGGSGSVSATYNAAMPSATAPTRTGYTFAGYYTAANGGGTQYYNASMGSVKNWNIASNTTLYAKWTANQYTVSFNVNGGSGGQSANVTATYGSAMPTISTTKPTKTGYTFTGWFDATSGGTQYYTAACASARVWNKASNATLYAQYSANKYTVTLDRQSGTGGSASVTATYNAAMPSATAPTRSNYTFGGYYTAANGGGTQYYNASMGSVRNWNLTANTTLYAKWTPNTRTITYNGNGSTGGSTAATTCNYNQSCTLRANGFTRTGYTFDGWYTAASGGTKYGATTTITADTTVYAHWKDSAGPTLTSSKSNVGSQNGVTITVTCSDSGSGCNQTTYTYSNVKSSQTYRIKDKAGNESSITVSVSSYNCNGYACNGHSCHCYNCNTYNCNCHSCPYSCEKCYNQNSWGQATCVQTTCNGTCCDKCHDRCCETCYDTCYRTCYK